LKLQTAMDFQNAVDSQEKEEIRVWECPYMAPIGHIYFCAGQTIFPVMSPDGILCAQLAFYLTDGLHIMEFRFMDTEDLNEVVRQAYQAFKEVNGY